MPCGQKMFKDMTEAELLALTRAPSDDYQTGAAVYSNYRAASVELSKRLCEGSDQR